MKNDVAKSILMQMPGMASNIVSSGLEYRARNAQMNAARAQQESQFQREMQRLRDNAAHTQGIEKAAEGRAANTYNLNLPILEAQSRFGADAVRAEYEAKLEDLRRKRSDANVAVGSEGNAIQRSGVELDIARDALSRGRDMHPLNMQGKQLQNRGMQQQMRLLEEQSRAAAAASESLQRLYVSGVPEHMRVDVDDADRPESLQKLRQLGLALPQEERKQFNAEVQRVADTALLKRRLNKNFDELQKIYDERKGDMNFDPVRDAKIIKKIQAISATNQSVISGLLAREPSQTLQAKFYSVGDPAEWSSVIPGMLGVHRANLMNHIDVVSSKATPVLSSVNALKERPKIYIFDTAEDEPADVATNPFFGLPGYDPMKKITR